MEQDLLEWNMSKTPAACDYPLLVGQEQDVKPPVPVTRRNLFGPVDHEQLQQDFERLFCMSMEMAKQRWSFDFQREQPMPGSVEWEELHSLDVPAFYRSSVCRSRVEKKGLDASAGDGTSASLSVAKASEKYLESRKRGTLRVIRSEKRVGLKHRQANITDFFRVKKRRCLRQKASSG